MKTCAVADCGISGGTKRDRESGMNFCPFHHEWFTTRYDRLARLNFHTSRRYDALREMRVGS